MSDTLQLLGELASEDAGRDAVHIAVAPVRAAYTLYPGDDVGFLKKGSDEVGRTSQPIGIVDPFLKEKIKPGQRFYLFLYPQTITSLRHVWQHPAFPNEAPAVSQKRDTSVSEAWLRDFCNRTDCPGYETLMKMIIAEEGHITDSSFHIYGTSASGDIPPEFWVHAEIVLGQPIKHKPNYFSCSC